MALAISVTLFILLLCAICGFGYLTYVKPARAFYQLTAISAVREVADRLESEPGILVQILSYLGGLMPSSPKDIALSRRELACAGYRSKSAPHIFAGIRIVSAIVFPAVVLLLRDFLPDSPVLHIVIPAGSAVVGYMLPGLVLDRLTGRRRERIRFALPDALDMLVVCSEVGCALDQAIQNVARDFKDVHSDLSDELSLINAEILAGSSRAAALRNFAERTGEEETKKLVAIMIQTDRFGTSIADSLRTQADYMRTRRRQEAEERAGKVGVKLVFPIFFFCMPSLVIIVAGPGIIQLFNHFLPVVNNHP
jgi:tight adherence protein C